MASAKRPEARTIAALAAPAMADEMADASKMTCGDFAAMDKDGMMKATIEPAKSGTVETIEADILGGRLTVNGKAQEYTSKRDESYRNMHRAAIDGRAPICTFAEGLAVMELIDASERALQSRKWIEA